VAANTAPSPNYEPEVSSKESTSPVSPDTTTFITAPPETRSRLVDETVSGELDSTELQRLKKILQRASPFVTAELHVFDPPLGGFVRRATLDENGDLRLASPIVAEAAASTAGSSHAKTPSEAEILVFEGLMQKAYRDKVAPYPKLPANQACLKAYGPLSDQNGRLRPEFAEVLDLGTYTHSPTSDTPLVASTFEDAYSFGLTIMAFEYPEFSQRTARLSAVNKDLVVDFLNSIVPTLTHGDGVKQKALETMAPGYRALLH
jgi:hypothetical protein